MKTLRILTHLALSDFRERTRRYSFLVVLGLMIYLGYLINTGDISLKFDRVYRGVYNSAWISTEVTLIVTFLLNLVGFFLINNSVERDARTGVGQIIATTPLKGVTYLFGKWLSHFLLLGMMMAILALASLVMQLLNKEAALDLAALLLPFVVIGLPMMGLTAGMAVFFESIPWLRGSLSNLVYFGLWLLVAGGLMNQASSGSAFYPDPFGFGTLIPSARSAFLAQVPEATGYFTLNFKPGVELLSFQWDGIAWTPAIYLQHGTYLLVAVFLVLLGSLFFERFDPSRGRRIEKKVGKQVQAGRYIPGASDSQELPLLLNLTPLSGNRDHHAFAAIFLAEVKLLVKGWSWWWYLVALGLMLGCLFVPVETVEKLLLAAWFWSILAFSSLGCREQIHDTHQLVFSTARILRSQMPASWLAGAAISLVLGIGAALAFLVQGEWALLASWFSAALFIPSLAIALGVWSGTNRLFEIIFAFWTMAAFQKVPGMDFIHAPAHMYLLIAMILFGAAILGRIIQLRK